MLVLTGAKTRRVVGVPMDNVGLVLRVDKVELSIGSSVDYPETFTRVVLKVPAGTYKHVDVLESPECILAQKRQLSGGFLAALLRFLFPRKIKIAQDHIKGSLSGEAAAGTPPGCPPLE